MTECTPFKNRAFFNGLTATEIKRYSPGRFLDSTISGKFLFNGLIATEIERYSLGRFLDSTISGKFLWELSSVDFLSIYADSLFRK